MSREHRDRLLVVALVGCAAWLRIWHLGQGLPDFVEEAIPLRRAMAMGGWQAGHVDLDPRFFNYPSLVIYLELALVRLQILVSTLGGHLASAADFWVRFQTDPTGPVLLARGLSVAADLAAVVGAWRVAERLRPGAGLLAGVVVTFAGVSIAIARLVQVDPVQGALMIWAVERLLAFLTRGGRGRLAGAIVLIGLTAGAKYPGGLLVVPLGWVLWRREGRRGLALAPIAAAGCVLVFLATTPYALLDPGAFWRDVGFERSHMATGHLGTEGSLGAAFAASTLVRNLGLPLIMLALGFLVATLRRARRTAAAADMTVALAWLPLVCAVALARMQAERYLVPLVPLIAVMGAAAVADLLARPSPWHVLATPGWRRAVHVLGVLVCIPVVWHGFPVAAAGRGHTQIQARRWLEAHVPDDRIIVAEPYTAAVPNEFDDARVLAHPAWAQASDGVRSDYLAAPRHAFVSLPLVVSGSVDVDVVDLAGRPATITLFPHADAINAVFYTPQLIAGVAYAVVSDAVRGRHRADPARYPRQVAFYALLDRTAVVAQRFVPGHGIAGPTITVYSLGDAFGKAIGPRLDPLWWTEVVPLAFRRQFENTAVPPAHRCGAAPRCTDGRPSPWVVGLRPPFAHFVAPFLRRLAAAQLAAAHPAAARQLATALAVSDPDDPRGTQLYVQASLAAGDREAAIKALDYAIKRNDTGGGAADRLRLATVLHEMNRDPEAARVLLDLLRAPDVPDSLARAARDLQRHLAPD